MCKINEDKEAIIDIVNRRGKGFIDKILREEDEEKHSITIVSNLGLHPIPHEYVKGDIYIASEGNLNFTSAETVNFETDKIIKNLKKKLFEKKWEKIYLLPFGHSVINMNIKIAVYRILQIETIDIFYFGNGRYDYIERDTRRIATEPDD